MSTRPTRRDIKKGDIIQHNNDYVDMYGNGEFKYLGSMCGPPNKRGIARPNHARRIPRAKRLDELDEEIFDDDLK